jgi:nicotinate-nucleotide pyrophosphorylase (carboxylating)
MDLEAELNRIIDVAIDEDLRNGDITSEVCISEHTTLTGVIALKQAGVIAGLPLLETLYRKIHPDIHISLLVKEGSYHTAGTAVAKISGSAKGILAGERIALNLLQHASGIATVTAQYVKKLKGLHCFILDTRKTLPGLRALEKYAVVIGGGVNHRFGLGDRFIIKQNHMAFSSDPESHTICQAVKKARAFRPDLPIEVEIHSLSQLDDAIKADVSAIMLTRMTPEQIKTCVKKIRESSNKKVYIESLGAITLDTIRSYAETGVDGIAISSVTDSVPMLEIAMRIK